jgi:2'-5' RNA ligase
MSAHAEPTARVFFALVPPPALQHALGELARDVARRAHGRPVPADNVHVTLAFIGSWPRAKLSVLTDAAATVRSPSMRVTLDTLGGFRRAGVAWIAPSAPSSELQQLAQGLARRLDDAGVTLEAREFHPHMTLARRCRGPYPHDAVGRYVWEIDAMTLMASDTRAEGARYAALARFEFA